MDMPADSRYRCLATGREYTIVPDKTPSLHPQDGRDRVLIRQCTPHGMTLSIPRADVGTEYQPASTWTPVVDSKCHEWVATIRGCRVGVYYDRHHNRSNPWQASVTTDECEVSAAEWSCESWHGSEAEAKAAAEELARRLGAP